MLEEIPYKVVSAPQVQASVVDLMGCVNFSFLRNPWLCLCLRLDRCYVLRGVESMWVWEQGGRRGSEVRSSHPFLMVAKLGGCLSYFSRP